MVLVDFGRTLVSVDFGRTLVYIVAVRTVEGHAPEAAQGLSPYCITCGVVPLMLMQGLYGPCITLAPPSLISK